MANAIEIIDLKKRFGSVRAVDGVTFEAEQGESFGFLGPNGAGKTTTIRCLMDFIRPTSGRINVFGKDAQKDSVEIKKLIGYLPGNVKLYGNWNGWDHIRFIENIRGKSKNVDNLIQSLDFNPKIKFHSLSSGNKQKLGLILTLMNEPKLLVMDEPTVGLDPLLQNTIYGLLNDLKKKGTTIFVSSHNLPEVEKICDRVGIIKMGKMIEVETLKELGKKRMHKIELRLNDKFTSNDFKSDGVTSIEEIPSGLLMTVEGDLNPIIQKISKFEIADIEISHANLEEIFLKFYEKDK